MTDPTPPNSPSEIAREIIERCYTIEDGPTLDAEILRESITAAIAREREAGACDACAGTGKPVSGERCMCGGSGRAEDAVRYLREALLDERELYNAAQAELRELQRATRKPARWKLRLICCGRDDGAAWFATWEEADRFRESYVLAAGHDRAAILEAV